jgi:TonB family protein
MKNLILALCVCLLPHALFAQTVNPTSNAPAQDSKSASPSAQAELAEAEKLSASVTQLYTAGNYKEALPLAQRVLALCEKVRPEDDPRVGSALNNLAVLYIALKEFDKAEPILERILARREKLKTQTSATTMSLLVTYGCLKSMKGVGKRSTVLTLTDRLNAILLQDALLAAGLPIPENLSELSSGIIASKPQPRYPREALAARLQGTVLMLAEADEKGRIVKVEPVPCSSGHQLLADAAVQAMRAGRFKPVSINGKSIKLKAMTAYNFVIEF